MDFNWGIQHKEIDGGSSAKYWDTVKRRDHQHPEQDLMLAVLKDALLNYWKNLRKANKMFSADDRAWFFCKRSRPFVFLRVCFFVLGLSSQRIRKRLQTWETE